MTKYSSRLEDRLARVQSPRSDALKAANHLFPNGNQRSDNRQSSELTGFISFRGFGASVPCKILDLSYAGARLKLLNDPELPSLDANDLPERVALRVSDHETELECQVRWRMGDEFGIRLTTGSFNEMLEAHSTTTSA